MVPCNVSTANIVGYHRKPGRRIDMGLVLHCIAPYKCRVPRFRAPLMPYRLGVEGSVCLLPYYLSSSPLACRTPRPRDQTARALPRPQPAREREKERTGAIGPCGLIGLGESRHRYATDSGGRRHFPCAGAGSRGHAVATTRTVWQQSVPLKRQAFGAQSPGCRRAMKGSHPRPQAVGGARATLHTAPGVAPSPS